MVLDNFDENNFLLLDLKGPKQYQLGLEIIPKSLNDPNKTEPFVSQSSRPYRYKTENLFTTAEVDRNLMNETSICHCYEI